jgi:hypothetical protein
MACQHDRPIGMQVASSLMRVALKRLGCEPPHDDESPSLAAPTSVSYDQRSRHGRELTTATANPSRTAVSAFPPTRSLSLHLNAAVRSSDARWRNGPRRVALARCSVVPPICTSMRCSVVLVDHRSANSPVELGLTDGPSEALGRRKKRRRAPLDGQGSTPVERRRRVERDERRRQRNTGSGEAGNEWTSAQLTSGAGQRREIFKADFEPLPVGGDVLLTEETWHGEID